MGVGSSDSIIESRVHCPGPPAPEAGGLLIHRERAMPLILREMSGGPREMSGGPREMSGGPFCHRP